MERVKDQKDFLEQIDSVVKNVKTRINDLEEYKKSFVDPEPQIPYGV